MFYYVLFCQHLARESEIGLAAKESRIQKLREEIGTYLKQIRESKQETQMDVAARLESGNDATAKSLVSKLEGGKYNASLSALLEMILIGYRIDFAEFCRYFTSEDKTRESEERTARTLLEQLLREGPATRKDVIKALKLVVKDET